MEAFAHEAKTLKTLKCQGYAPSLLSRRCILFLTDSYRRYDAWATSKDAME
jgi:hypothetical protein